MPYVFVCRESGKWHLCGNRCKELIETEHQEHDICTLTGRTAPPRRQYLGEGATGYDNGVIEYTSRRGGGGGGSRNVSTSRDIDDDTADFDVDAEVDLDDADENVDIGLQIELERNGDTVIEPVMEFEDTVDARVSRPCPHDMFLRRRAMQQHTRKKAKRERQAVLMSATSERPRIPTPPVVAPVIPTTTMVTTRSKKRKRYKINPTITASGAYADRFTCERLVALIFPAKTMLDDDRRELSDLVLRMWMATMHTESFRENKNKYSLPLFTVLYVQECRAGLSGQEKDGKVQFIPLITAVAKGWPGLQIALKRIAPEARVVSKLVTKFDFEFKQGITQAYSYIKSST